MDAQQISTLFQATLDQDPQQRAQAEETLKGLSICQGFAPMLLELVMSDAVALAVRQAGVIYLKNLIGKHWRERDPNLVRNGEIVYVIPDADKVMIRNHLVESIIAATEVVRVQLTVCTSEILSVDFPERWPDLFKKLGDYLTSDNHNTWLGSLLVLYQIVKKYEFKREEERKPVLELMKIFLPILQNRCTSLVKDDSPEASVLVAKVFKIFRGLIQLHLPLELINENNFPQWMGLFKTVLERPVPEISLQTDEDDRPQLPWWKAKKWAITVLCKVFDRYGCPGSEEKIYNKFADFYDKHYSEQITGLMLKILDQYRRKEYVSPRLVHHTLTYLTQGVYNARSWKVVKPHLMDIVKEIIFPLMCHSDEDEALWLEDPQEYIRTKYDVFEDFLLFSPNEAAKAYLTQAASKRKGVLKPIVEFIMNILKMNASQCDSKHRDGALHMVGSLATALNKKKDYKGSMEVVLVQYVFKEFMSTEGFLRARACWVVQQFSLIEFKDASVLSATIDHILRCLTDSELPVQVEAGIAVRHIIDNQEEKATELIRPHVKGLVQHLLKILHDSENDELTGTISKLVQDYGEEVSAIALELVQTLCATFMRLVESDEDYDNKSITAMGILETIQTVMGELEESAPIITQLEKVVAELIVTVLRKELMEYYEEVFSLINECTVVQVSEMMWNMLFLLHDTFQQDTADYFTEMMPCLHNYVTVDTEAFLRNPKYCEVIFGMCKKMLIEYSGEGAQAQAAKLLEVIILQYQGQMKDLLPSFIELALERLSKELLTSELRVMLIQVIIAALINDADVTFNYLRQVPNVPGGMVVHFLSQWLKDTDCFLGLHDRKVYIFGVCTLLDRRPPEFSTMMAAQFLPALILVFNGLGDIYEKIQKADEDEDEEIEEDGEAEELGDSDDEFDEEGLEYKEMCNKSLSKSYGEIDDDDWENELDIFTTPIDDNPDMDEYIKFKTSFEGLQNTHRPLFDEMTQGISEQHKQAIQNIINEGINKQKMYESRRLEAVGGYHFGITTVPQNFSFGGALS